jgi:hypothetical protein
LHTALEPHLPQQRIVPLLVQEKLVMTAQSGVDFTMLVEIRRNMPRAVIKVKEENHAFADMDEESDLAAASVWWYLLVKDHPFFFTHCRTVEKRGKGEG